MPAFDPDPRLGWRYSDIRGWHLPADAVTLTLPANTQTELVEFMAHIERELRWLRGLLSVTDLDRQAAVDRLNTPELQEALARIRTATEPEPKPAYASTLPWKEWNGQAVPDQEKDRWVARARRELEREFAEDRTKRFSEYFIFSGDTRIVVEAHRDPDGAISFRAYDLFVRRTATFE